MKTRRWGIWAALVACNEPRAAAPDPSLIAFEVDVRRWHEAPPECAMPDLASGSATSGMLVLRPRLQECWAMLQIDDPRAEGKLLLQVYAGPSGEGCGARTKARVGLSAAFAKCAEESAKGVHWDSGGRYDIPVTFESEPPAHPVDLHALASCARALAEPSSATMAWATDENGKAGGINVDPFQGDAEALGCVAELLAPAAAELPPSKRFMAKVRLFP